MFDSPEAPYDNAAPRARAHPNGRLAPGLYMDKGIGDTVRVVAVDAAGARVFDGSMTRAFFDEARRAGFLDLMDIAVDAVCCDAPEFTMRLGTVTESSSGSASRGD